MILLFSLVSLLILKVMITIKCLYFFLTSHLFLVFHILFHVNYFPKMTQYYVKLIYSRKKTLSLHFIFFTILLTSIFTKFLHFYQKSFEIIMGSFYSKKTYIHLGFLFDILFHSLLFLCLHLLVNTSCFYYLIPDILDLRFQDLHFQLWYHQSIYYYNFLFLDVTCRFLLILQLDYYYFAI